MLHKAPPAPDEVWATRRGETQIQITSFEELLRVCAGKVETSEGFLWSSAVYYSLFLHL